MPYEVVSPLPPYRGIVAVDAEKFSRQADRYLPDLSSAIPAVLEEAMARSGLSEVWAGRRFPQATGDGYVFGVDPGVLPALLYPFLDRLQETLEERDREFRTRSRELRLRLRVSINVGPVSDGGDPLRDRISRTTNDTFRLLNARRVQKALADSHPDVTFVVAVLSRQVFEDVVKGGFGGVHPDRLIPVDAEVPDKDFLESAWLYIPKPSGGSTPPGSTARRSERPDEPKPGAEPKSVSSGPTTTIYGGVGQNFSANEISGNTFNAGLGADFSGRPRGDHGA